jgi:hypothetical protein
MNVYKDLDNKFKENKEGKFGNSTLINLELLNISINDTTTKRRENTPKESLIGEDTLKESYMREDAPKESYMRENAPKESYMGEDTSKRSSIRNDFLIKKNSNNQIEVTEIESITKDNNNELNNSEIYISSNSSIDTHYENDEKLRIKFDLVRSKVNFLVTYKKEDKIKHAYLGGELIDVSIPHKSTFSILEVFKNKTKNFHNIEFESLAEENIIDELIVNKFNFETYTLYFYIEELQEILFLKFNVPWKEVKYKKRIMRLLFLNLIDLFIKIKDLRKVTDFINKNNDLLQTQDNSQLIINLEILTKINDKLEINNIYNNLIKLLKTPELIKEEDKFKLYLNIIKDFFINTKKIVDKIDNFNQEIITVDRFNIVNKFGGSKQYKKYKISTKI